MLSINYFEGPPAPDRFANKLAGATMIPVGVAAESLIMPLPHFREFIDSLAQEQECGRPCAMSAVGGQADTIR